MTDRITKALLEELAILRERLEKTDIYKEIQVVERMIARRKAHGVEQDRDGDVGNYEELQHALKPQSSPISTIKKRVSAILEGVSHPVPIREIFARLNEEGIIVPGDSPQSNLSAHLSRDEEFVSWGRSGWTLSSEVSPDLVTIEKVVSQYVDNMEFKLKMQLANQIRNGGDEIPQDVDRVLLQAGRDLLQRNLVEAERRELRVKLKDKVITQTF